MEARSLNPAGFFRNFAMKIVIFEGVTTSRKTSVIEEISQASREWKAGFSVISEVETLLPLLDNTDKDKSTGFLKQILKKTIDKKRTLFFLTACSLRI